MHAFHAALERAQRREGQARLLFYGASHVASDWFTNVIRKELQHRFGDAGHGFVVPVHPWRSYRHLGVHLESDGADRWTTHRIRTNHLSVDRYGLAGVAVETSEEGAYGIVQTDDQGTIGRLASRFELFFLRQPEGGSFEVRIDDQPQGALDTRSDGPEAAYATYDLTDGPHRFEVRARGDGAVRLFGVAVERDRPGVILDTLGINGARARYHLFWDDALYREHLTHRNPDLVVLAYGTNESGDDDVPVELYTHRLRNVLSRVRETVPGASCLLIGPTDRPKKSGPRRRPRLRDRPRTLELVAAQRGLSEEFGCGFFDLVAFMGGPMSMVEWVSQGMASRDHIHLSRSGYERLGQVLFHALVHGYPDLPEPGEPGPSAP